MRIDGESESFVSDVIAPLAAGGNETGGERYPGTSADTCGTQLVAHALTGEGFDASEDGTGRGTPLVVTPILEAGARTGKSTDDIRAGSGIGNPGDPMFTLQSGKQHAVAFSCKDHGADAGEIAPTLRSMGHDGSHANGGGQLAVAFGWNKSASQTMRVDEHTTPSLQASSTSNPAIGVRRLLPTECCELQGFERDFFAKVLHRGKPPADGPIYKSLGNAMAVPVVRWILMRIEAANARD